MIFPPHTGSVQQFTASKSGTYKLEVWGAQGYNNGDDGKGGYSYGEKFITKNYSIFVCVGEGKIAARNAYNGGAGGNNGPTGGGATHIATTDRGELKNYESNKDEVLIVAGGGGACEWTGAGGVGGGLIGGNAISSNAAATGGTQTTGGTSTYYIPQGQGTLYNGGFGQGGYGYVYITSFGNDFGSGGGGGWYGGGGTSYTGAGGGGSGHIGTGVANGETIAGDQTFPKPLGGTETGHTGNGYCLITQISF